MNLYIEDKIHAIDWGEFSGPEYYSSEELIDALIHLNQYDESKAKLDLDNKVLFAVGNNHAGTYYPAILKAADIIIEIEQTSENEQARQCASVILNGLYYFSPELGDYNKHSYEEIETFVKKKLLSYLDQP